MNGRISKPYRGKREIFKEGQRVTYIPAWCNGDSSHRACTHGVVEAVGAEFIYVNINNKTVACERSLLVIRS